jgi:hypothetical protein
VTKEVYEILGRPVTREQYEAASKKMDAPQSEVEKEMKDRESQRPSAKKVMDQTRRDREGNCRAKLVKILHGNS